MKNYCIQSVRVKVAAQNTKFSKIPAQRGPAPLQLARARIYSSSLSVYFFLQISLTLDFWCIQFDTIVNIHIFEI